MLVRDPVTGQVYDDGQPVQSPADAQTQPAAGPLPPPLPRIGSQPMPAPDDVRLLPALNATGAVALQAQADRDAADAAPTATGGAVIPSLYHGLPPVSPFGAPATAPTGTVPVAPAPPPVVSPTPAVPAARPAGSGTPGSAPAAPNPNPYQAQLDKDAQAARSVADQEGASAKGKAQAGADASQSVADQIKGNAQARETFDRERNAFVQARQDRLEAETDKLATQPFTSLWSRMDKGSQIGVALQLAVGGAAAALQSVGTGQVVNNPAVDQLNKLVADDLTLQRQNFERSKEVLALRRSNLDSAKELYALKSDQLAAKQAASLEGLRATAEARLKALGVADADIAQNKLILDIDQKLHETKFTVAREIVSDADKHALNKAQIALDYANAADARAKALAPKGAPANGEMLKARDFANRAIEQERTLASLPPLSEATAKKIREDIAAEQFYEKNPAAKLAAMKVGSYKSLNEKLNPDEQRYVGAIQEFNNAILRKESGAAISLSEWDSAANRYSIRPGDSTDAKSQKIANRRKAIEGLGIEGGQQAQVNGALDQLPPPNARWVAPTTGQFAGKHVLVDDQGHVYGVR